MQVLKIILLGVLVLALVGGGVSVAHSRGLIKMPEWVAKIPRKLPSFSVPRPSLPPEAEKQVTILSDRSKNLGNHVGQVMGSYIKESDNPEPLHRRTFEYARFMYCQQVVQDYQTQAASAAATASPQP